ncbi:hypothetical protein NGRA_2524 [Nosema granulosis]|uniref:Uncharacterized protein n=1 Tax=Nosema granulosis TaxID=83296 RepID=A0A9P6GX98_9MICR|nr:hypothetical protein NGRA_2524 [Nosema granulosis]
MQNNSQINGCNHDMATATHGVKEVNGDNGENVDIWLRDIVMIAKLSGYTESETIKAITLKLRGTALAWAYELLEIRQWRITLGEFLDCIKKRFGILNHTELSLAKFLMSPIPTSREEFSELLQSGTTLYERKLLTSIALTEVILTKSPDTLKPLLLLAAEQAPEWQSFIQRAEQVAFLAFPDKMLNRISSGEGARSHNYPTYNTNDRRL